MNRDLIILTMLKNAKDGLTLYQFEKDCPGVHYGDAIMNLRSAGHKIEMIKELDSRFNREIGRYFYKGKGIANEKPQVKKKDRLDKAKTISFKLMMNRKLPKEFRLEATQIFNLLAR